MKRSLNAFAADLGYTLFFDEERVNVTPTAGKEGLNLSEEELSNNIKEKWHLLPNAKREEFAQREDKRKSSHDELSRANYLMLAYREEILRWMVDLIRSPLPASAKHW